MKLRQAKQPLPHAPSLTSALHQPKPGALKRSLSKSQKASSVRGGDDEDLKHELGDARLELAEVMRELKLLK